MRLWRFALAMSFGLCLSGCAVGPDYASPEIKLPPIFETWRSTPSNRPSVDPEEAAKVAGWWKTLHDPELNGLVDRAVLANPDIEIALDRVQKAREHEIVVLGAALPTLGAAAGAGRGTGNQSPKPPRIPDSLDSAVNATGFKEITGVAGFDATWELDLFGKYRRELEAARYDTQAANQARNATVITVVAEVARNYAILRGLQLRVALLKENIGRAENHVKLTLSRYDQGLTNEGDVLLARRELEALSSSLPSLNAAIFEAESYIALLLGTFSGDVIGELREPRKIPHTPERLRPGQPVDLLRRRPDIRRAERELASATARIGVATADLFPRAGVNAGIGVQGGREAAGSSPPVRGLIWSVGPGIYWPLLDFGRLDAAVYEAEFRTRELLFNYRRIVIAAVEEVNTALMRYRSDLETVQHLSKAVDASRRAVDFQTGRYQQGISDFLNVLDAARQLYELEDQYANAQLAVAVGYIALYKALGGGWEIYQDIPPIPQPEPAVLASMRRLSAPIPLQDR
jgi:NodT family efflux transporter outer membrane factor (OMF) lipoprotein